MGTDPETRAAIEKLAKNMEDYRADSARTLERVDQTMKHLDEHIQEDLRRFELVREAIERKVDKEDHEKVEETVDKVKGRQNWIMGIGSGFVFIFTFLKDPIVKFFTGGS